MIAMAWLVAGLVVGPTPAGHVSVSGSATVNGTTGPFTAEVDAQGRFCYHARAPLPEAAGWDGTRAWRMGPSAVPRTVHGSERDALTGLWRAWAGLGPAGRRASHEAAGPSGVEVTRFEGALAVGGLVLPTLAITMEGGVETRRLEAERAVSVDAPLSCAMPAAVPAAFDPGVSGTLESRLAPTGHLLVRPLLNGEEVGYFVLDTGASGTVVSRRLAARLGLPAAGRTVVVSASGVEVAPLYVVDRLTVGPMTIRNAPMMELDLDYLAVPLGVPIAGIIGYDAFARAVVEAVPSTGRVRFLPPGLESFPDAPWQPLRLMDQVPVACARFSHGIGWFRLDLGAGGAAGGVIFHSPAVRALGLVEALAGGAVPAGPAIPVTLPWLELGGRRFQHVAALLWTGADGALADGRLTGNIGLGVLEGFALLLDYPGERYALIAP